MGLTVRHVFDFGADRGLVGDDLVRPGAWDALRTGSDGPFALAADRSALEARADADAELRSRAAAIASWAGAASSLASYGVGTAVLELWLTRVAPALQLILTDYAPQTVSRVAALLPEARVVTHDLRADSPVDADAHLLHRIDSELSDDELRAVLARFAAVRVLLVATEVAGPLQIARELALRARLGRRATAAGWLRTRGAFESVLGTAHQPRPVRVGELDAWALEPLG